MSFPLKCASSVSVLLEVQDGTGAGGNAATSGPEISWLLSYSYPTG